MIEPMRRDVHWSHQEDDILSEMARAGETVANIAKELNRSQGSVRNRASRLQITVSRTRRISLGQ